MGQSCSSKLTEQFEQNKRKTEMKNSGCFNRREGTQTSTVCAQTPVTVRVTVQHKTGLERKNKYGQKWEKRRDGRQE